LVDDVRPVSFHMAVSDVHDIEMKKLQVRKCAMHIIMLFLAMGITGMYCYYYTLACTK